MTAHTSRRIPARSGFTLIELLVAISIIAVLISMIAPAIQSSRRAARRMECLNNMRNVGMAILSFASNSSSALPPLSSSMPISNSSGEAQMAIGWPISILPALDNAALLKSIRANADVTSSTSAMANNENIWLPVLTCPDDSDSYRQPGGLSYVVNSGFISAEVWRGQETSTLFHQPYLINWKHATIPPSIVTRSTDETTATGDPSPVDLKIALATGVFWRTSFQLSTTHLIRVK